MGGVSCTCVDSHLNSDPDPDPDSDSDIGPQTADRGLRCFEFVSVVQIGEASHTMLTLVYVSVCTCVDSDLNPDSDSDSDSDSA